MAERKGSPQSLLPTNLLIPLRIFMGITFLYAGVQHLTDPSYFDPSKPGYIGNLIAHYAVGSPIHDFLFGVVEPSAVSFGYAVAIGESLIGVAVLLGFLFRIAAFAGLLLNTVFFLSATWNAFPFYFGSDIVFVMSWLTLLLTGPQPSLSVDGIIARRFSSLGWLAPRLTRVESPQKVTPQIKASATEVKIPVLKDAKLYPKQVYEVNRSFDRIKQQFIPHEEIQTTLEFVRAFVISLGADRRDAIRILDGLRNLVKRDLWEENPQ